MRTIHGITLACCLFGAALMLGRMTGSPPPPAPGFIRKVSEVTGKSRGKDAESLLAVLEERLTLPPAAPVASSLFSALEMNRLAAGESLTRRGLHGPSRALGYASSWAASDPRGMFAWLQQQGHMPGPERSDQSLYYTAALFSNWARTDMEAALAAASLVRRDSSQAHAFMSLLPLLWRDNPDRAREVIGKYGSLFTPALLFEYGNDQTGPRDLEFLASLPPGKTRGTLLSLLLTDAATAPDVRDSSRSHAPDMAIAFWNEASGGQKQELVDAGFSLRDARVYGTVETPPVFEGMEDLVREKAESSGDARTAAEFIRGHGQAWAARDPDAALAWARDHLKGQDRLELSARLFRTFAENDFDHAVEMWRSLPPGRVKILAASSLADGTSPSRRQETLSLLNAGASQGGEATGE